MAAASSNPGNFLQQRINMIRTIHTIIFCVILFTGKAQVIVDANATTRSLTGAYDEVNISGNIKLIISQSENAALAISADEEKYKGDINTIVKEHVLFISASDNKFWKSRGRGYTVYLSLKELNKVDASGAADIIVAGSLKSNSIVINLNGASSFNGYLLATNVKMELSGASLAILYGSANDFQITCNGASDVNGYEFITQNCNANASGASDMQINVQRNIDATASGASHIYYTGDASVAALNANGVSKILKKN